MNKDLLVFCITSAILIISLFGYLSYSEYTDQIIGTAAIKAGLEQKIVSYKNGATIIWAESENN